MVQVVRVPSLSTLQSHLTPALCEVVRITEIKLKRRCAWDVALEVDAFNGHLLLGARRHDRTSCRRFILATYGEMASDTWKTLTVIERLMAAVRSLMVVPFYPQRLGAALRLRGRITSRRLGCATDAADARHGRLYAHLYEG